jgi:glycosyltransferase involved in cell wall biosynthesis
MVRGEPNPSAAALARPGRPAPRIHLFEPTGHGGIAQHTVALARTLAAAGHAVVLHTAAGHERTPGPAVPVCACVRWSRRAEGGALRRLRVARDLFLRTVPHLARSVARGDVLHVQGAVWAPFALAPLALLRLMGRRVAFSPHNTFSRRGQGLDSVLLVAATRVAHANIAFSGRDEERLRRWGAHALRSPLIHPPAEPDAVLVRAWRDRWDGDPDTQVVLFAGLIHGDKRLDLVIRSAAEWPPGRLLAVAGEDRGDWERCRELADRLGVTVSASLGYLALPDFEAAIAAADVIVAPYDRASQSGVLVLASYVGTPAVASDVGGLHEHAVATFRPGDVEGLGRALDVALTRARLPAATPNYQAALAAHRRAYDLPETP